MVIRGLVPHVTNLTHLLMLMEIHYPVKDLQ